MRAPWSAWSLARQLMAIQSLAIICIGLLASGVAFVDARRDRTGDAEQTVHVLAEATAHDSDVLAALSATPVEMSPDSALQAHIEQIRTATATDFIVVMTPAGLRLTHPNPEQIGGHYLGNTRAALDGGIVVETFTGTLGPSVRAVVPVLDGSAVVGMVSVGLTVDHIDSELRDDITQIAFFAVLTLGLAAAATFVISRRLRRQTHGLGAAEITRMYESWDAVLHALREGLLIFDLDGRLQLANDEARRLLGLDDACIGRVGSQLPLPYSLQDLVSEGRSADDELHVAGDHTLVVNQQVAKWEGRPLGTVVTLRDQSELQALGGQVDSLQGFADSLRARMHEASNRLHAVITLVELGRADEAIELATSELRASQELTDRLMGAIQEPVLAALLLGKVAQAAERGVELDISTTSELPITSYDPGDLVTICGNLIDNATDAAMLTSSPRWVRVSLTTDSDLVITVADSGPGLDAELVEQAIERGWTTKQDDGYGRGLGLALVSQLVRRHAGRMTVTSDEGAVFEVRLPLRVDVHG